ncbi:lipopolysaccharide transport system permease protein [Desulfobaculum xiamenense]|uniref:Lipopolysaccharide transport system permease protein n=1 Tax=Desulfobaculum xiamenense TaxID=995050 RepID=A0A846QFJ3_9BACT|nr:ABC transporter permease [Desulfobaculum xiamenense]NJB67556.1 lipopolysaccharide transport system permease protein [Desulfobaculum xiamenense]
MTTNNFISLAFYKVGANLRAEVTRYYMNYLWWVLEPLFSMGIYYVVFGIFMHRGTPNFIWFLLVGLTSWLWFAKAVGHCSASIFNARSLLMQIQLTKTFFPLVTCIQDTVKQLFVLTLLLPGLAIVGGSVTWCWSALPLLLIIQFLLILGCGFLAAAIVPFFPDLKFIIGTGLQLLFFATGVFYDIEKFVLPQHRPILYLNPMAGLIKNYRTVLLDGAWPDWEYLGCVLLASIVLIAVATAMIRRLDHVYPRICQ